MCHQHCSVQSLSRVWLFATLETATRQASLPIINSRSLPKPMSIELVTPSNHLIPCRLLLLLLLPSVFPSIRVFSNGSAPCIRWPKYWSFFFFFLFQYRFLFILHMVTQFLQHCLSRRQFFPQLITLRTLSKVKGVYFCTFYSHQSFQRTPRTDLL